MAGRRIQRLAAGERGRLPRLLIRPHERGIQTSNDPVKICCVEIILQVSRLPPWVGAQSGGRSAATQARARIAGGADHLTNRRVVRNAP